MTNFQDSRGGYTRARHDAFKNDMYMYVVDEDTTGVPVASQNLSVIGTILKRYMYQNRYFNALSMMTTNFKIRNANVKVLTSEKFAEQVKWYDDMRKKYKKMIHEYEEILGFSIGFHCIADWHRNIFESAYFST